MAAALVLLCVGLIAVASVLVKIQTEQGEVVIATDDPNVEVVVRNGGKEVFIVDPGSQQHWQLDTEKYQLRLAETQDGLAIDLPGKEPFVLRRKGEKVATVTRRPPPEKVGEVRRFEGFTDPVWGVAISPDGRQAFSTGGWNTLWDLTTRKEIRRFGQGAWFAIFSPDGKQALTMGEDGGQAILWDVASGKQLREFLRYSEGIRNAAFSSDGRKALVALRTKVRVHDLKTGDLLADLQADGDCTHTAAFSPDGRRLLVAQKDCTLRLFDVATWQEVRRFPGHEAKVLDVAFSPDGRRAITGGWDKTLREWDVETGKELRCLRGHTEAVHAVAFCPDGRRVLSAGLDESLRLWDLEPGKELHRFEGHQDGVLCVAISPEGHYALSGGNDKTMRLWRLPDPTPSDKSGEKNQPR